MKTVHDSARSPTLPRRSLAAVHPRRCANSTSPARARRSRYLHFRIFKRFVCEKICASATILFPLNFARRRKIRNSGEHFKSDNVIRVEWGYNVSLVEAREIPSPSAPASLRERYRVKRRTPSREVARKLSGASLSPSPSSFSALATEYKSVWNMQAARADIQTKIKHNNYANIQCARFSRNYGKKWSCSGRSIFVKVAKVGWQQIHYSTEISYVKEM